MLAKPGVACIVSFRPVAHVVGEPIHFYGKLRALTVEVEDEPAAWVLPTKL